MVGMAVGLGWFLIAAMATVYAVVVPRIPHVRSRTKEQEQQDE